MTTSILTPKLKLAKIISDVRNWARTMNDNLSIIDAVVSAYMVVNNLKGVWSNSTSYVLNDRVVDPDTGNLYTALVPHTSASIPSTFAQDFAANPTFWILLSTSLGFGTAAFLNTGTGPNNVLELDATAKIPKVDGTLIYPFASHVKAFGAINSAGVLISGAYNVSSTSRFDVGGYQINYSGNFGANIMMCQSGLNVDHNIHIQVQTFSTLALIFVTDSAGTQFDEALSFVVFSTQG